MTKNAMNILVYAFWWICALISLVSLGVRLLGHRAYIWLVLIDAAQQFSEMVIPIYTFTSST